MTARRRTLLAATLLATTLAARADAQPAADSFYTGLMRDGRTALLRGDAATAKRDLRLACFGLLDSPVLLAECRIRLGLAEAALGDREAFLDSFSRLEDLEQKFQVYAAAAVTADERRAFEERLVEWVSPDVLRTMPAFAPLLSRRGQPELARLSPRERIQELERRAAAEPGEPRWKVQLAAEELERKRPAQALARLARVPDDAQEGEAGCLRGRALAELERCAEGVAPLAACVRTVSDARLADTLLACYADLEKFDEARAFANRLAEPVAALPQIRKRIERIPKPAAPAAAVPAAAAAKPAPPGGAQRPPKEPAAVKPAERAQAAPAPSPERSANRTATASEPAPAPQPARAEAKPTASERRSAAEIRAAMQVARTRQELEAELSRARALADRYPGDVELQHLAGELGYRVGQWGLGATYLARPSGEGPSDPTLRFYLAVCQYESGDRAAAARTASRGLEKLPRSAFVDGYLKRIAAPAP